MDMLPGPAMADNVQYPIDVAELWGPDGETGLSPASPFALAQELRPVEATPTNGNGEPPPAVDTQALADVARLADAIAANHADVVRRSDLDSMRKELEGAFTQQLAVALYELTASWNSRFSTAEAHISERVTAAGEAQNKVLASSIEANFYAVLEMAETVRAELGNFRSDLAGVEGLSSFQRELRHDVARLGDLVAAPRPEASQAEVLAEALRSMQKDLAELRQDILELRAAVDARVPRGLTVQDV
jgi:hypothetical protein